MIVFDENMQQRSIMDAVAAWYRGRVISVTVLRPGTIIKDEAIRHCSADSEIDRDRAGDRFYTTGPNLLLLRGVHHVRTG